VATHAFGKGVFHDENARKTVVEVVGHDRTRLVRGIADRFCTIRCGRDADGMRSGIHGHDNRRVGDSHDGGGELVAADPY
jgi:hypothetical protein